jgi:hypothetical protein
VGALRRRAAAAAVKTGDGDGRHESFVDAGNPGNSYSPWRAMEHEFLEYRGEPLIPRDDAPMEDCD